MNFPEQEGVTGGGNNFSTQQNASSSHSMSNPLNPYKRQHSSHSHSQSTISSISQEELIAEHAMLKSNHKLTLGGKPPLPQHPHPQHRSFSSWYASPSPNTLFRKRLQAISEDQDGQQSVVLQQSNSYNSYNSHSRNESADSRASIWSSLSASMSATSGGESNNSYNSGNEHQDWMDYRMERMARFEEEQQALFEEQKKNIERKMRQLFERDNIDSSIVPSSNEKNELIGFYMRELENERQLLISQWKNEMNIEEAIIRENFHSYDHQSTMHRLMQELFQICIRPCVDAFLSISVKGQVFISNIPVTISALGLSWVIMGVVWLKFTQEMIDSCVPVHFFSSHCSFPEFPGCYECETSDVWYQSAVQFHFFCTFVAGACCILFILKLILSWRIVVDELCNPITSTPCAVFCITTVCVFAGRGPIGELLVITSSIFHFLLSLWFLYMAIYEYRLWPDPGWFPAMVGLSYVAIKTWIYFPVAGRALMMICVAFFMVTFIISVIRVASNHKIAAPVCWMQLYAPSITMYAISMISQPTKGEEEIHKMYPETRDDFHDFLIRFYMPLNHLMMFLSLIGLLSAVHSLITRWEKFIVKPFSPCHLAFVFPSLAHANAVQSYRSAVNVFSTNIRGDGLFHRFLFGYWCTFLVGGTILNVIFTFKFASRLQEWTRGDIDDEEEIPPSPDSTLVHEVMDDTNAVHELVFYQPFISPAVLQANETGSLRRLLPGTDGYQVHGQYVRTRRDVPSYGFDPVLSDIEFREERDILLHWVANHSKNRRNRTLSNTHPLLLHLRGNDGDDKHQNNIYGSVIDCKEHHRHSNLQKHNDQEHVRSNSLNSTP